MNITILNASMSIRSRDTLAPNFLSISSKSAILFSQRLPSCNVHDSLPRTSSLSYFPPLSSFILLLFVLSQLLYPFWDPQLGPFYRLSFPFVLLFQIHLQIPRCLHLTQILFSSNHPFSIFLRPSHLPHHCHSY